MNEYGPANENPFILPRNQLVRVSEIHNLDPANGAENLIKQLDLTLSRYGMNPRSEKSGQFRERHAAVPNENRPFPISRKAGRFEESAAFDGPLHVRMYI